MSSTGRFLSAGLASADEQETPALGHEWPGKIVYSLVAGASATVVGAAVSLTVQGMVRVAVWCVVSATISVAAGLAHESAWVSACRAACHRLANGIART
jgi:hypothetical protein